MSFGICLGKFLCRISSTKKIFQHMHHPTPRFCIVTCLTFRYGSPTCLPRVRKVPFLQPKIGETCSLKCNPYVLLRFLYIIWIWYTLTYFTTIFHHHHTKAYGNSCLKNCFAFFINVSRAPISWLWVKYKNDLLIS